ncbi:hypothetical protein SAVIM40S_01384 [Streptomyces avidinii]
MYDSHGDTARVPELLDRVERDHDSAAWHELERRLTVGAPLTFPASFAALPRLVRLAGSSSRALGLAGRIVRYAAATDGCDDLLENCTASIVELGSLLDEELRARPDHYLDLFRYLLATRQQYHWAAVLQDSPDAAYRVGCPHCPVDVTMVIGSRAQYSTIRTEQLNDVGGAPCGRRPPSSSPARGDGCTRRPSATAGTHWPRRSSTSSVRAECPRCAALFTFADEYTAANRPLV